MLYRRFRWSVVVLWWGPKLARGITCETKLCAQKDVEVTSGLQAR